jgi:uncharacterized Zn-binding protein involved in type VI secretion
MSLLILFNKSSSIKLGAARATQDQTWGKNHNWVSVTATQGSPNVIINGKQVIRVGDPFPVHSFIPGPPSAPHTSVSAQGSSSVIVNGLALSRGPSAEMGPTGDQTSCSDTIGVGSSNVIVGG